MLWDAWESQRHVVQRMHSWVRETEDAHRAGDLRRARQYQSRINAVHATVIEVDPVGGAASNAAAASGGGPRTSRSRSHRRQCARKLGEQCCTLPGATATGSAHLSVAASHGV